MVELIPQTRVSIGGLTVIASGSVVLRGNEWSTTVWIDDLMITFAFDPQDTPPQAVPRANGPKGIVIEFSGIDNPLGISYQMDGFGTWNGKPLNVTVMVHTINGNPITRLVSYTFTVR